MSHEHTADGGDDADGDRAVSVLGVAVVIEEDFVAFPWRAGFVRGPVAFGVTGLLVLLVASPGGLGTGPLVDQLSLVGLVVYNAHNVPAATGLVPGAVTPVAEAVVGVPVLGRALRGLFVVGQNHAAPASHVLDVFGGKSGTIGHVNFIAQQDQTEVPAVVYYLIPVVVLVAAGWEFAVTHWDEAATDSPVEVTRFGLALAVGYVAAMLLGTVLVTVQMASPLQPGTLFTVLPDRYLTAVFGFVYLAVLGSVGAGIVYVQLAGTSTAGSEDATEQEPDA